MHAAFRPVALLLLGAGTAFAQAPAPFEVPRVWPATEFLGNNAATGPGWQVGPTVANDGLYNTWSVTSAAGTQSITGTDRLTLLLLEVEAIRWLQDVSRGREFALGLRDAGQAQLEAAAQIVRNPVETARQLPGGAARFLGRVGGTVRNAVQGTLDVDPSATTDQTARRLLGAERAKRLLAAELGVSAYSRNPELQRLLDEVSLVRSLGRVTVDVGSFFLITGTISHILTGINVTAFLTKEQIAAEPRDLAAANRLRGLESGVPAATVDAFLANPLYDPWTSTAIWNCLATLGVNPTVFVEQAAGAASALDAFFFLRTAQMMAALPRRGALIQELVMLSRTVVCVMRDGSLVAPLWLDYAIWTPDAQAAAERFRNLATARGARRMVVLTNGRFSPAAISRLQLMGIEVVGGFVTDSTR